MTTSTHNKEKRAVVRIDAIFREWRLEQFKHLRSIIKPFNLIKNDLKVQINNLNFNTNNYAGEKLKEFIGSNCLRRIKIRKCGRVWILLGDVKMTCPGQFALKQ
ncbi:hypothetical protein ACOME3_000103 [Neoechinorhynchus agilis]